MRSHGEVLLSMMLVAIEANVAVRKASHATLRRTEAVSLCYTCGSTFGADAISSGVYSSSGKFTWCPGPLNLRMALSYAFAASASSS